MSDVFLSYKNAEGPLPGKILTWHLYGAGVENFGRDGKPEEYPMPSFGPDQLLVRIDAIGICFSDLKVINLGNKHPRVVGRDLISDPVTLGHEAAVTVVGVGDSIKDRYSAGDRFVVQADVFYKGKSMAFGYVLSGAQTQYQVLTRELLNGDDGCYLIPMADSTGYSEAAIAEPWACVVAAYRIGHRASMKPGGSLLVVGTDESSDAVFDFEIPSAKVVIENVKGRALDSLRSAAGDRIAESGDEFDDIIVLGADAGVIEKAAQSLGRDGIMCIVSPRPMTGSAKIDVGKIHYMNHLYIGTGGAGIADAYVPVREHSELAPGGTAWFIGGGGPMGQMHVQRAVDKKDGPKKILATDVDTQRLNSVRERYASIAESRGVELVTVNPNEMSKEDFDAFLNEFAGGRGFDDIVVLAPVAALISHAVGFLGEGGFMNIFAGVPIGTIADLDLSGAYLCRQRVVGSSGSRLSDMQDTLRAAESGNLSTDKSVAAIGGIEASWDGMVAVKELKFTGRVVIYPQIRGLELTRIEDLKDRLPTVYAKLTDGSFWNREAEKELIRVMA